MNLLRIVIAVLLAVSFAVAQQPEPYSCPMHEHVHSAQPGKCPICGMQLVEAKPAAAKPAGPVVHLEDLEKMALAANPAIGQAAAMVDAAKGRTQQAGLWPNPSFGASGEHVSTATGGGAIGGFVEQRFVTAGKLGLNRKIAAQEQGETVQFQEAQKQRVLTRVRSLYYQALGDQLLLDVRTDLVDLARRTVKISGELYNVGLTDRPDLLAAEVEAERIDLELIEAQNARQRTWRELAAVTNNPGLTPAPLEGDLEEIPKIDADAALEIIYRDSPELRSADLGVERANLMLKRARVDKIPDVQIRGGLRNNREFGEAAPNGPIQRRGLEGIFDATVEIPIFNRNQGGVKAARAEAETARLEVERTKLSLKTRLAMAYKEYRDSAAAVERYRDRMLPKAKQAYELHLASFSQMTSAYPQVLMAQRNWFQLRDGYVAALVNAWRRAVEIQGLLLASDDPHN